MVNTLVDGFVTAILILVGMSCMFCVFLFGMWVFWIAEQRSRQRFEEKHLVKSIEEMLKEEVL